MHLRAELAPPAARVEQERSLKTFPVADKLPKAFLAAIGEVVTTWARLEVELRAVTFLILRLGPKQGRTAVRTPRPKEMVQMIEELAHIEGLTIKRVDTAALQSYLEEIEGRRNLVAHGLWLKGPKRTYMVQNLQGSWPKQGDKKVRKRIDPEGITLKAGDLHALAGNVREAIGAVRHLSHDLAVQLQSQGKQQ